MSHRSPALVPFTRGIALLLCLAACCHAQIQRPPVAKWQEDGITAALDDPLPAVWVEALDELAKFSQVGHISSSRVARLLSHPDNSVRTAALQALGVMRATDQADAVERLLADPVVGVRGSAARALGEMGAVDRTAAVAKLLNDPGAYARSSAADSLGLLKARDRAGEIAKLLGDRDPMVRRSAVQALGAIKAPDQMIELVRKLHDPDLLVRSFAVRALGAMPSSLESAQVAKLLADPDPVVRVAAIQALGAMRARDYAAQVAAGLNDSSPAIRSFAAQALGAMQANNRVADLVRLLNDPNSGARSGAATALAELQAANQVPNLVKLLRDPDAATRIAAANALARIQAGDHAALVATLLEDPDDNARASAARALGAMQAKQETANVAKLLRDPEGNVRAAAALSLAALNATDRIPEVAKLTRDDFSDARGAAAQALGKLKARSYAPELVRLLRDTDEDGDVAYDADQALIAVGPIPEDQVVGLAEYFYFNHAAQTRARFLCYYLTGGAPKTQLVIRRIMFEPHQQPARLSTIGEARNTLQAFHEVMPAVRTDSNFADDADRQILEITARWKGQWSPAGDHALFAALRRQMGENSALALDAMVAEPWWLAVANRFWKIVAIHLAFWFLLLYFYPSSPHVQAFFFWNRWARRFIGLGYVDFFLTWVPPLRNRLLAPFREELAADARTGDETLKEYFDDLQVQLLGAATRMRLDEGIHEVRGQIVLEGESGLGKSMFLRRLVRNARVAIAYLPAEACDAGVAEAIQRKLKGKASDETFLKSIIWSGGLRIIIDGLNEVSVETREKIRRFLDDFPKAHVLLATQPMLWKRPPKAKVFRLLKLSDDRILSFLESRYVTFTPPVPMTEAGYVARCKDYLDDVLGGSQSEEDQSAARLVLSNPMDLTTAARILIRGERPTLNNLQQQQFEKAREEFDDTHPGQEFPLRQFSESVYDRRLSDELALDTSTFFEAVEALVVHKMVLEQNDQDSEGKPTKKWVFRHDKIRDYFLMQAVLAQQDDRIPKHVDDPRFRGVYLMLASQLPLDQARDLRDALVDRASETKDHHLSDEVVQILKTRRPVSRAPGFSPA